MTRSRRGALSLAAEGKTVARATAARRVTPGSVHVRKLTGRRDAVAGYPFVPANRTRRPAALVFGGSEGGNSVVDAAGLLASTFRLLVHGAVPYLPHSTHQELFGGTLRGDAAARADLWPRILGFFANL